MIWWTEISPCISCFQHFHQVCDDLGIRNTYIQYTLSTMSEILEISR